MAQATNTQLGEIQLTGDLAGNGGAQVGTNPQLKTMPGLVPGTYTIPNITVDAKGRVTTITNGATDLGSLLPHAATNRAGLVSVGDNLFINGESIPGYWTVNFGGLLALNSPTGLSDQACAQYSFDLSVDNAPVQKILINGAASPTIQTLINQLNSKMQNAVAGLVGGNLTIVSHSAGNGSTIALTNVSLFACVTGYVSIGTATEGSGSCELYAKRASDIDYGVVKIGAGIAVDDGVISIALDEQPLATTTTLGTVKVPTSGHLAVDVAGNLTAPVATAGAAGVVQVGSGLAVNGAGLLSVDTSILPVATTTTKGAVQVGSGLAVNGAGVLSIDSANMPLPNATTSTKGAVQVGTGLAVASGVLSAPAATSSTLGVVQVGAGLAVNTGVISVAVATASTLGAVKPGSGLTIAGDGTLSTTAVPDATTSSKGIVQIGAGLTVTAGLLSAADATSSVKGVASIGAGLSVSAGVLVMAPATTSTIGGVKVGTGLTVAGDGTVSADAVPDATTSTKGIVQVGSGLNVSAGVVSVAAATGSTLGGVKIGANITIASGVITVPYANTATATAGLIKGTDLGGVTFVNGVATLAPNVAMLDTANVWNTVQAYAWKPMTSITTTAVLTANTNNNFDVSITAGNTTTAFSIVSNSYVEGSQMTILISHPSTQTSFTFPAYWLVSGYVAPVGAGQALITGFWNAGTFYATYTKLV